MMILGLEDHKRGRLIQLGEVIANAHDHDTGHRGMLKHHGLQLRRGDVRPVAAADLEELLDPIHDEDVAILVEVPIVPRVEPAFGVEVAVGHLVVLVALESTQPIAHQDLARLAHAQFLAGDPADDFGLHSVHEGATVPTAAGVGVALDGNEHGLGGAPFEVQGNAPELLGNRLSQVVVHGGASREEPLDTPDVDAGRLEVRARQAGCNRGGDEEKADLVPADHVDGRLIEGAVHEDHGDPQQDVEAHVELGVDEEPQGQGREPHIMVGVRIVRDRADGPFHRGNEMGMAGEDGLDVPRGSARAVQKRIVLLGAGLRFQPEEVSVRAAAGQKTLQRCPQLVRTVVERD